MAQSRESVKSSPAPVATLAVPVSGDSGVAELPPPMEPVERDKVLPLQPWLVKVYFIFPVVLYIPDAIFNYYVYSHGINTNTTSPVIQGLFVALWAFLAIGIVGMAYLLSVLAPWHWGQGHRVQALFCGLGVLIATAITTWNSLAYRSQEASSFSVFQTDKWAYNIWPQLQRNNISLTMILVAVAPPFWGLFWAIVQPTQSGRSLRQLQESHAERLLRLQQESELKRVKAETTAKIREAQLRGMARTAATAREQAREVFAQRRNNGKAAEGGQSAQSSEKVEPTTSDEQPQQPETLAELASETPSARPAEASNILDYPRFTPNANRELAGARGSAPFMSNHAAAATPNVHAAPATGRGPASQPMLLSDADVADRAGMPEADTLGSRRPALFGAQFTPAIAQSEMSDVDAMTGTTGPRQAVRRSPTLGSLTSQLNQPVPRQYVEAIRESLRQLDMPAMKPTLTPKEIKDLTPLVAERLGVDEAMARKALTQYSKGNASSSRR